MVELLAPAGDFISLRAVLENGADSVYIGLKDNNMRANASNFTLEQVENASKIVNQYNSKLYLCTNIIMKDNSIQELKNQLPTLKKYGVDGLIISDIGLIDMVTSNELEAHISVQENISNSYGLKTLKKLGAKRAILSRELSLNEIKDICSKSPIETEVFIHGAMCMAISGRCFLSYGLYGRSANCGDCLQPCRKVWKLNHNPQFNQEVSNNSDLLKEEESILISSSYDDSYKTNFFSPKDLTMIQHIPELIKTGVDAFKIEGRARSADYGATAVNVYREAIDLYDKDPLNYKYNPQWMENLNKVFNRGFDTGFYFNQPCGISENNKSKYIKKDIGKIVNYYPKVKVAELKIWDDLAIGDEIMIQGPTTGSITHIVESMGIDNKQIQKAVKGFNIGLAINHKLRESDFVYKLVERKED